MRRNAFYPLSCIALVVVLAAHQVSLSGFLALLALVWANVAIHELGHVVTARWTGGHVTQVRVLPWHGRTTLRQSGPLAGAFVALAGPMAGFIAAGLVHRLAGWDLHLVAAAPLRTICAASMLDNLLNLMPIWILDGRMCLQYLHSWQNERDMAARIAALRTVRASMTSDRRGHGHVRAREDSSSEVDALLREVATVYGSDEMRNARTWRPHSTRRSSATVPEEEASSIAVGSI